MRVYIEKSIQRTILTSYLEKNGHCIVIRLDNVTNEYIEKPVILVLADLRESKTKILISLKKLFTSLHHSIPAATPKSKQHKNIMLILI